MMLTSQASEWTWGFVSGGGLAGSASVACGGWFELGPAGKLSKDERTIGVFRRSFYRCWTVYDATMDLGQVLGETCSRQAILPDSLGCFRPVLGAD